MKVGIWIRVSTEDQARGESPANHTCRAQMYAGSKGWQVTEIYDLSGVSGKDVLEHPEAKRMMSDVKAGRIKSLIFSKLARLARNTRQLLEIAEFFKNNDANLVSLEESIDTSTPAGRLLYTVIGALAQWEREEISARISASVPIRAKLGKHTGGQGPFGYHWVDGKLIPNPAEATIVSRIYELYLETGKVLTACNRLAKEGFRARRSEFSPRTLKYILSDPVNKGERRANYSKQNCGKLEFKKAEDWVVFAVEPIIDGTVWERANQLLGDTRLRFTADRSAPKQGKYMFSGLLVCACGGGKMYCYPFPGMTVTRYTCRACKTKVTEDAVEKSLQYLLHRVSLAPENLCGDSGSELKLKDKQGRLGLLGKELKNINKKIDTLVELFGDNRIDQETFTSRFDPLTVRRDAINKEMPRLQGEIDFIKSEETGRQYVVSQVMTLAALWQELTYEARQEIVREIVERIEVGKESLNFVIHHISNLNQKDGETLADFPI
ncbi:MAG: resolvase [Geobacteraceae bacterium GWC2_55_20]|nr:MAG: resolvase [Geobacteraceae bacterium GWC2_55_20]OGU25646.1 MAG: resolvase [Geobacteraceae bacterium GWF2_54_21]HBA71985.1 recombinase family protein [Geobacter sp.]HCE66630.1 recombinase family protein [Geobacter sp.]